MGADVLSEKFAERIFPVKWKIEFTPLAPLGEWVACNRDFRQPGRDG